MMTAGHRPAPGSSAGGRRAARPGFALTAAFLLVACSLPRPALGWQLEVHRRSVADAAALLPAPLRDAWRLDAGDLREGSTYPDLVLQDYSHHFWCPGGGCGDGPDHIASIVDGILEGRDGAKTGYRVLAAFAALLPVGCTPRDGGAQPGLALKLGILAHYVADLCVPYHTVPLDEASAGPHLRFEREADEAVTALVAPFDGMHDDVGETVRDHCVALAAEAHADLARIAAEGGGAAARRRAIEAGYTRAVNAVADVWYSLLLRLPEP